MKLMNEQNPVCILIIDDQKADRLANIAECQKVFRQRVGGMVLDEAVGIDDAIQKMATRIYQIILLDKDLGKDENDRPISGIDHIRLLQEIQPVSQIIMLTASMRSRTKFQRRSGTARIITSSKAPTRSERLSASGLSPPYQSSMDGIELTISPQKISRDGIYAQFICLSPAMIRFDQKIKAVADSQHPALLLGPSGIGKGAIARRINEYRSQSQ